MRDKDSAWHIDQLRHYAGRLWSVAATANVLSIDRTTVVAWAKKYNVDFSGYDREAAKRRSIWFAMNPMRRLMTRLKALSACQLRNNPPSVSGEPVKNIIEWQEGQWQGLTRKRLWLKLRFANGRRVWYDAESRKGACVFSPKRKNRNRS